MSYDFCFLVSEYTGGGIERIVTDIANRLTRTGKRVAIISLRAYDRYQLKIDNGVTVVHLDEPTYFAGTYALHRWIKENPSKVLIGCDKKIAKKMLLVARVFSRYPGKVVVLRSQRLSLEISSMGVFLLRWLYPKADVIIAKSELIEQDLRHYLPSLSVKVISSPIDLAAIQEQAQSPIPHPWLTFKVMPVIVAMGRMVPQKEFENLLRAFSLAKEKRSLRLILLGDGYHRDHLEHLAKKLGIVDSVSFPGFTNNPYVYLKNADLFVMSSKNEGFPLGMIEAMACGCNVVVSDKLPEASNHVMALEQAILERLDAPVSAAELQAQAQPYDIRAIADVYAELDANP